MSVSFEYSFLWLIPILIFSILISYFFYKNDDSLSEINKKLLFTLRTLRFLVIFLISILLLKPLINNLVKNTEKAEIVILQDNSESIILTKDSSFYKNNYLKNIKELANNLNKKAKLNFYTFSSDIHKNGEVNFEGDRTNISGALQKINDLYSGRNLSAVILASDGIANEGFVSGNTNAEVPVYSVLLGDTTVYEDIAISDVLYNKDVFINNNFPLLVKLKISGLPADTSIKIKVKINDKLIAKQQVLLKPGKQNYEVNFKIKAEKKGIQKLKIQAPVLKNEQNKQNNFAQIFVNVVDKKKNILILANSPHPDIKAIKSVFKNSAFINVKSKIFDEVNTTVLKDIDLVILHQLPSVKKDISNLLEKLKNQKIPVLVVLGTQTDVEKINKYNFPFELTGKAKSFEYTQATGNNKFELFTLDENVINSIKIFPPLYSPFRRIQTKASSSVLLFQKIKNIATDRPLMLFTQDDDNIRYGIISGEGLWKWRINDFVQNSSFSNFNILIEKTIQYLTATPKNKPLIVFSKNTYNTSENIELKANFYNSSQELYNAPDLSLKLKNDSNQIFNYIFDKNENNYSLKLGRLPEGNYLYTAFLEYNGKKYTTTGNFSVFKVKIENKDLIAKHSVLKRISHNSGGKYYYPNELKKLENDIVSSDKLKNIVYYENNLSYLSNKQWYFWLIILLISLEWFIRKYKGSY